MTFGLFPQHEALIRASGIAPEVAEARGYVSCDTRAELARRGFGRSQRQVPGLLLPLWRISGERAFSQYRPDAPRLNSEGKPVRYETPQRVRMTLDVHPHARPWLADPQRPLYITEGIRKADAAVSRGLCCVALLGVWNWRGRNEWGGLTALADWELIAFNGRQVYIVFDSDVMVKPEVQKALVRLTAFLEMRGAHVAPSYLPAGPNGEKVGLDDFLAAGHTVEDLLALVDGAPAGRGDVDARPSLEGGREARRTRGFPLTDLGNAERLVAHHGRDLQYDHTARAWFWWDGRHWAKDTDGEAHRRAKATVRSIYAEAGRASDEKARQAIASWALRSEADARVEAMLSLATSERGLAVTSALWDADLWALTCLNGTLDLRTGTLRPHRREDLITKLAPVAYDPDARSDLWEQTLEWALPDHDVRAFYQRAVGYSLTADTREDKLFFVHGPTATVKSTLNEAIKATLGDYAMTADFETFLRRRDVGGPRNDLARLAGARLVLSIEVEQGRRLAEGLIKMLTGGDTIAARFLFHEAFEFRPSFTLWLVANHAPKVPDDDDALWRRIVRIPFEHVLPKEDRDPTVKAALRDPQTAGAAILAWAVEGCLAWQRDGLQVPPIIETATDAYRADMDPLADFFEGCCVFDPQASVAAADLRAAYETWAKENGERPLTGKDFGVRLRARGCAPGKRQGQRGWRGVGLGPLGAGQQDSMDGTFDNLHSDSPYARDLPILPSMPSMPSSALPDDAPPVLKRAVEIFDGKALEYRRVTEDPSSRFPSPPSEAEEEVKVE